MSPERFFKDLLLQLDQELPFVAYRKPNELQVQALLMKEQKLDRYEEGASGFVFSPFDETQVSVFFPMEKARQIHTRFEMVNKPVNQPATKPSEDDVEREAHIKLVSKAIVEIKNSKLKKVVLSRKENQHRYPEPLHLFQSLLEKYPTAFVYCWYHPLIGLWLGATPETLLQVRGQRFKTMALAGTQAYTDTMNVVWGSKELEEQQLVSDYILSSIKNLTTEVKATEAKTVKAGNLLHLQTIITGKIKSGSDQLQKLVEQLHPTPAVCGLPRDEAKQFILKNESYSREYYTGYLGELHMTSQKTRNRNRKNVENNAYNSQIESTNLYVNLRCVKFVNDAATVYVGGGITADSNPEAEWLETVHKAQTIKSLLH